MSEDTDEIATSPIKGDSTRSISLKRLLFGWGFGIAAVIFIVSTAIGVDSREQDIRQGVIDLGVRQASELAIVSERTLGIVDVILPEIMMQVVTTPSVEVAWIVDPQQKVAFPRFLEPRAVDLPPSRKRFRETCRTDSIGAAPS